MAVRGFVGVLDRRNPITEGELDRLRGALPAGPSAGATRLRNLGLAWVGDREPTVSDQRLRFLDGVLHEAPAGDPFAAPAALRGDFLLLQYDAERDELEALRDQNGCRALFWHLSGSRLTFASEVRYVLDLLPSRPGPDPVAFAHWLSESGTPGDRTLYAGIHALLPCQRLRFAAGDGAPRTDRYWTPTYRRPGVTTFDDAASTLRDLLVRAVERRVAPDGSTAVLLSGGLDSTSVAAVAARGWSAARPLRGYSATFPRHPTIDERALIDLVCARTGIKGSRLVVRAGSPISGAVAFIDRWLLPPASPNVFFWAPLLDRAAADGTSLLLDGEGGDEIFGLSPGLVADAVRRGRFVRARSLVRQMPGGDRATKASTRTLLRHFGYRGAVPLWLHRAVRRRRAAAHTHDWLRPEVVDAYFAADVASDWKQWAGPLWWAWLVDVSIGGLARVHTTDHVRLRGALAGIEATHPLLDVDVVEHILATPPELAFDTRFSRPLLRAAMEGWLPDAVRLRPDKSNFDALFHESLAGVDLAVARRLLRPGEAELGAYVDLERVGEELLASPPPAGQRMGWGVPLWRLVTAECWLRAQNPARAVTHGDLAAPDVGFE